uniref:TPM domain-containing protein n=1 Tax=Pseudopedobacter sp. TaxID=1936787 RepID=UPI003340CEA9
MKKILFALLLITSSLFSLAQDFPPRPNTLVNDYTGTLSNTEIQSLESKLVAFDDSTSIQVAVVLIRSLDGYEISDYGY